jgi:hypothetical protein
VGQIAKLGSFIVFGLAGVMGLLTMMGFWHLRKVEPEEEILAPPIEMHRASA